MKKTINIQSRLTIILMLISLLPLIAVCLVFKNKVDNLQKKSLATIYERDFEAAQQYIADQEVVLVNQISALATQPLMQEVLANDISGQIKNHIEQFKTDNPLYQEVIVANEKSAIIASTNIDFNQYIQNKIQVGSYSDTKIRKEIINRAKSNLIQISTPIYAAYSQDTCIGFLVVFLNSNYFNEVFSKFQINHKDNPNLIYAIIDNATQDLLYSNTNLVNSYNYNLLSPSDKLSNIQIANSDFVFSKFVLKTNFMLSAHIYIGMLSALAHKINPAFNKLFELVVPLIIIAQLVIIFFASQLLSKWMRGATFQVNNADGKELPNQNVNLDDEKRNLTNIIDKILSISQDKEDSHSGLCYVDQIKKEVQQISVYLFNIRLELAKAQIHSEIINNLLEQVIAKTKQLQESLPTEEGYKINSEKAKINNLLEKLSSQVAIILR